MGAIGNRNSQHSFAQTPKVRMARSVFDRSHGFKDTFDFDYLTPFYCDEIIPGDTINLKLDAFVRLTTQLVPTMDNMYLKFGFFYVPNRINMDNFERLCGAQDDPGDSTDFILPQMTFPAGGPEVGSIFDHYGLPTDIAAGYTIKNTLPIRCYPRVYNDWFKDQNLQDNLILNVDDGPDAPGDFVLQKVGKKHDYFVSCLPFLQKGDPVLMPLGGTAPVISDGTSFKLAAVTGTFTDEEVQWTSTTSRFLPTNSTGGTDGTKIKFGNDTGLVTNLAAAVGPSVNEFRQAIMMQSLFELDARGGTRYVEILQAHYNVTSPDFRLQRSEYLGGGHIRLNTHPVAQTSESATTKQANLAAFTTGSTLGGSIGFSKSFVEHGYVIGVMWAVADITYQQGVNRMFNRSTRYDIFWPKFQELGEQAVLNSEIFVQGTAADDDVFGYQERYADYRYKPSEIRGQFRSTFATSLDSWHLAEEFGTLPLLNDEFIVSNTPIDRILAVTSVPDLKIDGFLNIKHARPMATYGVPASLGRF